MSQPLSKTEGKEEIFCVNCGGRGNLVSYHGCPIYRSTKVTRQTVPRSTRKVRGLAGFKFIEVVPVGRAKEPQQDESGGEHYPQ